MEVDMRLRRMAGENRDGDIYPALPPPLSRSHPCNPTTQFHKRACSLFIQLSGGRVSDRIFSIFQFSHSSFPKKQIHTSPKKWKRREEPTSIAAAPPVRTRLDNITTLSICCLYTRYRRHCHYHSIKGQNLATLRAAPPKNMNFPKICNAIESANYFQGQPKSRHEMLVAGPWVSLHQPKSRYSYDTVFVHSLT